MRPAWVIRDFVLTNKPPYYTKPQRTDKKETRLKKQRRKKESQEDSHAAINKTKNQPATKHPEKAITPQKKDDNCSLNVHLLMF